MLVKYARKSIYHTMRGDESIEAKSVDQQANTSVWSLDEFFRRNVLSYFIGREEETAQIDDIIDYFGPERDEMLIREGLEEILQLITLPELAEKGIITYDRESKTIRYRGDSVIKEHHNADPEFKTTERY